MIELKSSSGRFSTFFPSSQEFRIVKRLRKPLMKRAAFFIFRNGGEVCGVNHRVKKKRFKVNQGQVHPSGN